MQEYKGFVEKKYKGINFAGKGGVINLIKKDYEQVWWLVWHGSGLI